VLFVFVQIIINCHTMSATSHTIQVIGATEVPVTLASSQRGRFVPIFVVHKRILIQLHGNRMLLLNNPESVQLQIRVDTVTSDFCTEKSQ
jgi:hypothetical protein